MPVPQLPPEGQQFGAGSGELQLPGGVTAQNLHRHASLFAYGQ
ncbi:hypothetical protein [Streptomyces sp. LUP30]|nr:hypothetical protein [Streptomyces sp. LUP30]